MNQIWTIGHSTHPFDEFVNMLQSFQIEMVVDIRSFPGSRKFPQFNKETLVDSLPQNGIAYFHLLALGGRRKVLSDSINTNWRHPAFRGYADYMQTPEFIEGIKELEVLGKQKRVTYMCSEAVWWRCHRSMISDYLKFNEWKVMHIMAIDKATEHPYTSPANIKEGELTYHE